MRSSKPLTVLLLCGLSACSGEELPRGYRDLAVPEQRLADSAAIERGRHLYSVHCALCHGDRADGRGRRRNLSSRPTAFNDPTWLDRLSPRQAFLVVREGRRGTAMPAWKNLEDGEIWDLVAYLRAVAAGSIAPLDRGAG